MKNCKHCKFSKLHWTDYLHYPNHWNFATCTNPNVVDEYLLQRNERDTFFIGWLPSSGVPDIYCSMARKTYGECKPEALYFEEKGKW